VQEKDRRENEMIVIIDFNMAHLFYINAEKPFIIAKTITFF